MQLLEYIKQVENYSTIVEAIEHNNASESRKGDNLECISKFLIFFFPDCLGIPSKDCVPCTKNFSQGKIEATLPTTSSLKKYIFSQKIHSGGDKSDFSLLENKNLCLHLFSCKNGKNQDDFDISKLEKAFLEHNYKEKGFKFIFYIIGQDKNKIDNKINRIKSKETKKMFERLKKNGELKIIDYHDLQLAWLIFKQEKVSFDILFERRFGKIHKPILVPYLNQLYLTDGIMKIKNSGGKDVVLNAVPRCGKTYICFNLIKIFLQIKPNLKILWASTKPTESFNEVLDIIKKYREFDEKVFKTVELKEKRNRIIKDETKPVLYLHSKHIKVIEGLKKINFDLIFIDEPHSGGCTELAQELFKNYTNEHTFTVRISGTPKKVIVSYGVPIERIVSWVQEDNECLANFTDEKMRQMGIKRYGESFKQFFIEGGFSYDRISEHYIKNCPKIEKIFCNLSPGSIVAFRDLNLKSSKGSSMTAMFMIDSINPIQHKKIQVKFLSDIFGKWVKTGEDWVINDKCYMFRDINRRVEEQNLNEDVIIILFTLPKTPDGINKTSKYIIKLIEENGIFPVGKFIAINGEETGSNSIEAVKDGCIEAKYEGKKYLVCFIYGQLTTAVTLKKCDIIIRCDDWNDDSDTTKQLEWRCLSGDIERGKEKYKKFGFVIDANFRRFSCNVVLSSTQRYPDKSPKGALIDYFANLYPFDQQFEDLVIDTILTTGTEGVINNNYSKLKRLYIVLTNEEKRNLKALFKPISKKISKILKEDIPPGIEATSSKEVKEKSPKSKERILDDFDITRDVLTFLVPIYALLGVRSPDKSFIGIHQFIFSDLELKKYINYMFKIWWKTEENMDEPICYVYENFLKDSLEFKSCFENIINGLRNISDIEFISTWIDEHLIVHENEKSNNAEVSTPSSLRNDMLDTLKDFWNTPKKVFEPCCGKGGFLVDIIQRFMSGLEILIPDKEERYRIIVEDCLYFADINPLNIYICKIIIDPKDKYKLNFYTGNTLKLNTESYWGISKFNATIGNPPYNSSGNIGTGNTIWQDFSKKSLNEWIAPNGYLLFVHPPGWRKPNTERGKFYGMFKDMTETNQMLYLEIHGIKDGQKVFNCGTRYDWYLIERKPKYKNTIVIDENNTMIEIDMDIFKWLPNSNINTIQNILAKPQDIRCPIIYNRSNYGSDNKKYISKVQNEEYKYPVIHTIPLSGVRYIYSSTNGKGHFGVSKVIFGDNGLNDAIIDMDGQYAMSENSMAIEVDDIYIAQNIKKALLSKKFKDLIKCCIIGNFRIDWRLFSEFKKDFWKEFI